MTERDLSDVPPEVLEILTHGGPYSPGDAAILRAYAREQGANPIVAQAIGRAMQNTPPPSTPTIDAPRRLPTDGSGTLNIPTLDLPNPFAGIGNPFDALLPDPTSELPTIDAPRELSPQPSYREGVKAPEPKPFYREGVRTPDPMAGSQIDRDRAISQIDAELGGAAPSLPDRWGSTAGPAPIPEDFRPSVEMGGGPGVSRPDGSSRKTDWMGQPEARAPMEINAPIMSFSPDSIFASLRDDQISRVAANPSLVASQFYPDAPLTQASQTEWLGDVMMLAELGLLDGSANATVLTKPGGPNEILEQVEALKNAMPGRGGTVDPRAIYHEAFSRIINSDAAQFFTNEHDGVKGDAENQVAVSNGLLAAATPFLHDSSREAFIQRLNSAGMQYLGEVARSGTSLSYPEWLQSQGATDWL